MGMKTPYVTRPALAAALGVAVRTIAKFQQDGMPVAEKGAPGKAAMFDLPGCITWLIDRRVVGAAGGDLSPMQERALLDRTRREELELKLRVRRGELVEVAEVEREFGDCAAAVKARLRRIPDAVADRVLTAGGPHQVKALLLGEIDSALLELSRRGGTDGTEAA
jgi:phage terminase Nu1 subunit (DNA packaging protein)